jgi:hypothetical protein
LILPTIKKEEPKKEEQKNGGFAVPPMLPTT